MTWDTIANIMIGGVLTGLVYALMALGLSVIFGVIKVVNFAHGEMMALAMYAAFVIFSTYGLDPLLATPIIAGGLFLIGYIMQRALVAPFVTRPEHEQFILLLAVAILLVNGLLLIFGPDAQSVMVEYGFDSFEVGPLILDKVKVYAAAASIAVALSLLLFFKYTRTGKAIRACSDNLRGAQVVGLNIKNLYALTFGLGAACVGAAGCLLSMLVDITPMLAPELTLLAFIIVIIGGLGSLSGALLGGVLIGASEALAGLLITPSMKSLFSFGLLILVLAIRPQGLLGKRSS
ncbi:MAG: branched-chain amino acid ABC transporter permease [Alphaproteobacteria bacterium]|nr:branched-chain amino acid ABC transporter permease [Rhodospirillales bacterium]MCW9044711.1 branched-chain amino acid ABC transporter permease [Alphaproteobacteria bacterium]